MGKKSNIKIDPVLKSEAEKILKGLGLSPQQAVKLFYEQVRENRGLPFKAITAENQGIRRLDKSWQGWVKENLSRDCDPQDIVEILLKNNFALAGIKEALGEKFPENLVVTYDNKVSQIPHEVDYERLTKVRITDTKKSSACKIPTDLVQLYMLDNFLSEKECDELVKVINQKLRPSEVSLESNDKYFRTSTTCDLIYMKNPIVEQVDNKIADVIGINLKFSEGIQAQKYEVGQQFKPHTDYFEPMTAEYEKFASKMGNRTWTFMVYLNETEAGGGTSFVNLNHTFFPKKGTAVIWNNLYADGTTNPDTLHCGEPVEKGQKIIITKWFREKGGTEMFPG